MPGPSGNDAFELAHRLVATVSSRESAAWLGVRYLREHMNERHVELLAEALVKHDISGMDRETLQEHLELNRRVDFAVGDIVKVNGWLLSRSEARLYALAALL